MFVLVLTLHNGHVYLFYLDLFYQIVFRIDITYRIHKINEKIQEKPTQSNESIPKKFL